MNVILNSQQLLNKRFIGILYINLIKIYMWGKQIGTNMDDIWLVTADMYTLVGRYQVGLCFNISRTLLFLY